MADALIGYTGFVGSHLARQNHFDAFYNSKNIEEISDRRFNLLVCSGMPAAKWIANREPEADLANARRLFGCLRRVEADRVVLISTVDVYPVPVDVDEDSPIDQATLHAYGKHRLMLEVALRARFPAALVVRLPGLFGEALKKNVVYDLIHDNETHKIHADGVFQFYNLEHLWEDVTKASEAGLGLVNFATEPFSVGAMAAEAFGLAFGNRPGGTPARYDFRTKYAQTFGGVGGYLYPRERVLRELGDFVARERSRLG